MKQYFWFSARQTIHSRRALVVVLLTTCWLAGCGGGGGGSSNGPAPGTGGSTGVTTYGDTTLPGRLVVNAGGGKVSEVFDLRTGQRAKLPASSTDPEHDSYSAGADTTTLLRLNQNIGGPQIEIAFINATGFAAARAPLQMSDRVHTPLLSADGRFILTFWDDHSSFESNKLTIFDTATGAVVKRTSRLDGFSVIGDPAAWLPDGRYVYLVKKSLYVTAPDNPNVDLLIKDMALPSDVSADVSLSSIAVSPDGKRLAFDWVEPRKGGISNDSNLWVVNLDGTGLHRLTSAPDPTSPLDYVHGSPTWSPDGKWVAGVLYMSGVSTAPAFPDAPFGGDRITGFVGCCDQVFVVDADGPEIALSWPSYDAAHGVKVFAPTGTSGQWLGTNGGLIYWIP